MTDKFMGTFMTDIDGVGVVEVCGKCRRYPSRAEFDAARAGREAAWLTIIPADTRQGTDARSALQQSMTNVRDAFRRGGKKGNPNGAAAFGDRTGAGAAEARQRYADEFAQSVIDKILPLHNQGYSLRQIASELNNAGVPTRRGSTWTACSVNAVLKRAANE